MHWQVEAGEFPGPILPGNGSLVATNLSAKPDCDPNAPGRAIADLHWTPAATAGREQRVAVTIYPDGFEKGQFDFSPTLAANATNLVWRQLRGQATHYWRVLTLHTNGWVPSVTSQFDGPTCVADQAPPPGGKQSPRRNDNETHDHE